MPMTEAQTIRVQGRDLTVQDLQQIRDLIANNPTWSRRHLSIELCERWQWRADNGKIKDMSCRNMLLKLHRMQELVLPKPKRTPPHMQARKTHVLTLDETPLELALAQLQPLKLVVVDSPARRQLMGQLLKQYHYLGHDMCVGENLGYIITANNDRPLGCMLFGAAAWKVQARDRYIGWTAKQRQESLQHVTGNTRFLLLPHVRVKCLASHVLGMTCRRLNADWRQKYGHDICLVETFVDRSRFRGTCYQAANWQCLGQTTGRTRQDRHHSMVVPRKDVYVYALDKRFRRRLCQ